MDFETWEPVYERILADFGYDRAADEAARDVLADLTGPFDRQRLDFEGQTVAVVGAGPSLRASLGRVGEADRVVAASTAARVLREVGIHIDLMVTDLDGHPPTARELTAAGTPVAVHAHGDNADALRRHVPTFEEPNVLPTTQAEPRPPVCNFGGFTDGDRAAFTADALGAESLTFPGWDLDDPSASQLKRRKLQWAARLLAWLERRRSESFAVLDGRRADLEPL
ncbi:MAG: 6-hydroxymethylpterin diphosphokinase MptE-like protein [Halobacteriaceae archaeon]